MPTAAPSARTSWHRWALYSRKSHGTSADCKGATHELPIMVPIAFVLEFFVVGKIAKMLAFTVMRPTDRPQFITYAISICICCIMCPIMSLVATFLFKEPSFGMWVKTWAMNFPMAICYQMFYCGPFVRLIFRAIFVRKNADATEAVTAAEAE